MGASHLSLRAYIVVAILAVYEAASNDGSFDNEVVSCGEFWNCKNGVSELSLEEYEPCGNSMPISDTATPPTVSFKNADPDASYLLIMVDPDTVDLIGSYFLHWAVKNIKGSDLQEGNISGGQKVAEYKSPAPPAGQTHTYKLLLFKTCPKSDIEDLPSEAGPFNFAEFLNDNNLCDKLQAVFAYMTKKE